MSSASSEPFRNLFNRAELCALFVAEYGIEGHALPKDRAILAYIHAEPILLCKKDHSAKEISDVIEECMQVAGSAIIDTILEQLHDHYRQKTGHEYSGLKHDHLHHQPG